MNANELKKYVLENKTEFMGKLVGDKIFGGVGEKTIKLNGSVPEECEFVNYDDVISQNGKYGKALYTFFFETTPETPIEMIQLTTDDFENEIETILKEKGIMTDGMLFQDSVISHVPFRGTEEKKEYIAKNCIVFYDENNVYFVKEDVFEGDFNVEQKKRKSFKFLFK